MTKKRDFAYKDRRGVWHHPDGRTLGNTQAKQHNRRVERRLVVSKLADLTGKTPKQIRAAMKRGEVGVNDIIGKWAYYDKEKKKQVRGKWTTVKKRGKKSRRKLVQGPSKKGKKFLKKLGVAIGDTGHLVDIDSPEAEPIDGDEETQKRLDSPEYHDAQDAFPYYKDENGRWRSKATNRFVKDPHRFDGEE